MVDPIEAARRIAIETAREIEELDLLRRRAREAGSEMARRLCAAYPEAGRVRGFGSVFEGWRSSRRDSDIDLAVESGNVLELMRVTDVSEFPIDLMVLGSCLHGLYNAFEAYFLRVAKFFENNVDRETWHRDLPDRMLLDLPGMRPALIGDRKIAERIDELRRFRHLFRNLYKTRLNAVKLRLVDENASGIYEAFLPSHRAFRHWLAELGDHVGESE